MAICNWKGFPPFFKRLKCACMFEANKMVLIVVFGENNNRLDTNKHNCHRLMADTQNTLLDESTW